MDLKKVDNICTVLLCVFLVLMFVMAFTQNKVFGYAAIAVVAVYVILLLKFWRCPSCERFLGALWVKHCPHCGEKIR